MSRTHADARASKPRATRGGYPDVFPGATLDAIVVQRGRRRGCFRSKRIAIRFRALVRFEASVRAICDGERGDGAGAHRDEGKRGDADADARRRASGTSVAHCRVVNFFETKLTCRNSWNSHARQMLAGIRSKSDRARRIGDVEKELARALIASRRRFGDLRHRDAVETLRRELGAMALESKRHMERVRVVMKRTRETDRASRAEVSVRYQALSAKIECARRKLRAIESKNADAVERVEAFRAAAERAREEERMHAARERLATYRRSRAARCIQCAFRAWCAGGKKRGKKKKKMKQKKKATKTAKPKLTAATRAKKTTVASRSKPMRKKTKS